MGNVFTRLFIFNGCRKVSNRYNLDAAYSYDGEEIQYHHYCACDRIKKVLRCYTCVGCVNVSNDHYIDAIPDPNFIKLVSIYQKEEPPEKIHPSFMYRTDDLHERIEPPKSNHICPVFDPVCSSMLPTNLFPEIPWQMQSSDSGMTASSTDTTTLNTKAEQLELALDMLQNSILQIENVMNEQMDKYVEIVAKEELNADIPIRSCIRKRNDNLKKAVIYVTKSLNQMRSALNEQSKGLTKITEDRIDVYTLHKTATVSTISTNNTNCYSRNDTGNDCVCITHL
ncbi:unnamed protein product [Mytilus coruscus]|uniref:Uncharacterized protein n=1 Tax=Mytilus coruscus TaxID=42192 RepID=A0A6J8AM81_MYTCO|nr:unnamed protein product [Mytilus coruscus]